MQGFDFLIAVIGLFGIGEILLYDGGRPLVQGQDGQDQSRRSCSRRGRRCRKYWMTSLRSCLIGCWMGITPGGATPASFMSYGVAQAHVARTATSSATGQIEGVIAPETAAHAAGTQRAAADAHARHPGLADGRGAAGRPADLGPAAGAAAVRREEGLRLGADRQHVPRQHRRPDHRAHDRAAVGRRSCASRSRSSRR